MKTNPFKYIIALFLIIAGCAQDGDSPMPNPNGIAGSMARFALSGDHLYTVDNKNLNVFDISLPSQPVKKVTVEIAPPGMTTIETIFPYQNNLFLGANNGMYIFNIDDPVTPKLLSHYAHITACDPVIVKDTLAYVTLRSSGRVCGFGANVLEVINIKDLNKPQKIKTYNMQNPHGLGITNENILFITEGNYGLKVFDASDPLSIKQTFHFDTHGYDVIPVNDLLILIGNEGLYQYKAFKPDSIELLSTIPILSTDQ